MSHHSSPHIIDGFNRLGGVSKSSSILQIACPSVGFVMACALSQGNAVEFCWGQPVPYQQDIGLISPLPRVMSPEQLEEIMHSIAGERDKDHDGSTLSILSIDGNNIIAGNLGDSPMIAFFIYESGKVKGQLLNGAPHELGDARIAVSENWIKSAYGPQQYSQDMARAAYYPISISHAIGDCGYDQLSHEPAVRSYVVADFLKDAAQLLLVAASDGIMPPHRRDGNELIKMADRDWVEFYSELLAQALQKNPGLQIDDLVHCIGREAQLHRAASAEFDNLLMLGALIDRGVISSLLNPWHGHDGAKSLVLAVADGHRPDRLEPDQGLMQMRGLCARNAIHGLRREFAHHCGVMPKPLPQIPGAMGFQIAVG